MRLAVVGSEGETVCRAADIEAAVFPTLAAATGQDWELLALTRDGASASHAPIPRTHSLLLPGDCAPTLARHSQQVVSYGFSPRDTITLSSACNGRMLCLQRNIVTLSGNVIEPQELSLPEAFTALSDEEAMLTALLILFAC